MWGGVRVLTQVQELPQGIWDREGWGTGPQAVPLKAACLDLPPKKTLSWEHPQSRHFPLPYVAAQARVQPLLSPMHTWMHIPLSIAQLTELMQRGLANTPV